MDFAKLNIEVRTQTGKGGANKVRVAGKVPGILYGGTAEPTPVTFDSSELLKALDPEKKRNTIFDLTLAGAGKSEQVNAIIRDAQIHPLSRQIVHVDFLRIRPDEDIEVTVPLLLVGKAIGVINGGNLHQSAHVVRISAKPAAIPAKLEIDVSELDIGDALHASDLKLGEGIRVLLDAKQALASVVAPRAEKVEEVVATVEGAVPAAAGAAVPAADAAADPAAAAAKPGAAKKEGEKKGK